MMKVTSLILFLSILNIFALNRNDVVEELSKQCRLLEKFNSLNGNNSNSKKDCLSIKKELDNNTETNFNPILLQAESLICKNSDAEILSKLVACFLADKTGDKNRVANLLGKIYYCQSELVLKMYNGLIKKEEKDVVYSWLVQGYCFEANMRSDVIFSRELEIKLLRIKSSKIINEHLCNDIFGK